MRNVEEHISTEGEVDAWVALEKSTSEINQSRVDNCKGDVDTLLVFAGLYSAVLTAFLIESYKTLQEDPQESMIDLLRQISLQTSNYSFVAGRLTSAFMPSPPTSTFQPSVAAIRVNVCWFASLVLSLSAASFGMLVQQWLREYLYIDRSVPQERIRIRHFRSHGLEAWKLFEIAAILPLILQISLALFFTGLCFFTASVHPSVGAATLVLVSGWAALFGFALLAPLISPRCPYKTTFLKAAFRRVRSLVRSLLEDSLDDMSPVPAQPEHAQPDDIAATVFSKYEFSADILISEEDSLCRTDQNDLVIFHAVDSQILDDALLITIRKILFLRPPPGDKVLQLTIATVRNRLAQHLHRTRDTATLVPIAILSTLSRSVRVTLIDILADALHYELTTTSVDQWYLDPGDREWLDDALILLIALVPPSTHVPDSATSILRRILQPGAGAGINYRGCALLADRVVARVAGSRTSWQWQVAVFSCLSDTFKDCDLSIFRDIVHWSYIDGADVDTESDTYNRLLEGARRPHADYPVNIHPEALAIVTQVAVTILYYHLMGGDAEEKNRSAETYPAEVKQLLGFILDSYPLTERLLPAIDFTKPKIPNGIGVDKLFAAHFSAPALVPSFLECMWARPDLVSTQGVRKLLQTPFHETWKHHRPSSETQTSVLNACAHFFDGCQYKSLDQPSSLRSILGLYLVVATYPTQRDEKTIELWRRICDDVLKCVKIVEQHPDPSQRRDLLAAPVAYAILDLIDQDSEDQTWMYRATRLNIQDGAQLTDRERAEEDDRYSRWRAEFNSSTSFYTNELVEKLRDIADSYEDALGRRFWRVRHVQDTDESKEKTRIM